MDMIHAAFLGGAPGGMEVLLILVALLLLFGARRLPGIARSLGKTLEQFRRAARDVTDEVMHADTKPPARPVDVPDEADRKELPDGDNP